jgi:S-adenosylmethionine hydrolase
MAQANDGAIEIVHTNKPEFWLPEVSQIFHGRDIFSPVGAHLAAGVPLAALGMPIDDAVVLALPQPQRTETGWRGEVIFIDDFGNVHTNLLRQHLAPLGEVDVTLDGVTIAGMVRTFGERPLGSLIALYGTEHDLNVAVVNGNAAQRLGAKVGDVVVVNGR